MDANYDRICTLHLPKSQLYTILTIELASQLHDDLHVSLNMRR